MFGSEITQQEAGENCTIKSFVILSSSLLRIIESRNVHLVGHVTRVGDGGMSTKFLLENLKERNLLEHQTIDRKIFKWNVKRQGGSVSTGCVWLWVGSSGRFLWTQ
jgi:hypothetical protein